MNKKLTLNIAGMTCVNCANNIKKALQSLEGVVESKVNFASTSANIIYNEAKLDENAIISKVKDTGYSATYDLESIEKIKAAEFKNLKKDFFTALVFTLCIAYFAFFPISFNNYLMLFLASIVQFVAGRRFYIASYKALKNRNTDMNVLVALGTSAAFFYSAFIVLFPVILPKELSFVYFDGAAVIITFVLLGRFLEEKSKNRATSFLKNFSNIAPQVATLYSPDGNHKNIAISKLKVGDVVIVKAGDKISADGQVIEGSGDIDSSFITGESLYVFKTLKDSVIAGTILKSGYLKIRVTKKSNDTLLSNIISLLNLSSNARMPIARFADRVSSIFVPAVVLISISTFIIWSLFFNNMLFAIITSISVLIISCPCALGLATPITIVNAVGRGAKDGILIKNPEILEIIHDIKFAVFDKTGTLTKGEISVDSYLYEDKKYLCLVASAEKMSEHPISFAIVNHAKDLNIKTNSLVSKIETISGKGIKASINDMFSIAILFVGTKLLLEQNGITIDSKYLNFYDEATKKGKGVIFASYNNKCVAVYSLSDSIKDEAKDLINFLKSNQITPVLLTGDNKKVAKAVAKELSIEKIFSDVLPNEKYDVIKSLQNETSKVMFVGDGVNDALALKKADIGIAMNSGSDIAKDAGDILLINSNLVNVKNAIKLSKSSMQIIKQNLFWAFIYNIIGIPIAAGILFPFFAILLTPVYAGIAMSFSSVTVVLNSLRISYLNYSK